MDLRAAFSSRPPCINLPWLGGGLAGGYGGRDGVGSIPSPSVCCGQCVLEREGKRPAAFPAGLRRAEGASFSSSLPLVGFPAPFPV